MRVIKEFSLETAHIKFTLTIFASPDGKGFVGEYFGKAEKFGQVARPTLRSDEVSGRLERSDIDALIVACRAEIESIYGRIGRTVERNL